jgi:Fic family protein
MHEALHELENYFGNRHDDLPFLIQLALVHYQFETIHPFMDGNGRVGRLLIALQLRQREYLPQSLLYVSGYFERHRDEYRDAMLAVSRSGTWSTWIDFFLRAVAEQSQDTVQRSYQLLDLRENYRNWALATIKTGNLSRLVDLIFERPIISISDVEQRLAVTPRAASQLVHRMVDRAVLMEVTGRQRNRQFAALEVLEILSPPDD